jgi:His-Xaa-Ser system protein HxsD
VTATVTVVFDRSATTLDAVQQAAYALAESMTVDLVATPTGWHCTIHGRQPRQAADELAHLLRERVLDETLRARIAVQTEALRNLVFAVAYSQTGLVGEVSAGASDAVG